MQLLTSTTLLSFTNKLPRLLRYHTVLGVSIVSPGNKFESYVHHNIMYNFISLGNASHWKPHCRIIGRFLWVVNFLCCQRERYNSDTKEKN